ncbi:hypothetical protein CAPTEDRAFT_221068 [Capitella teleta]|uniref:Uncharacterized protein n=1 Tax=Capitella teleta TaxID=283909 RepID=R7UIK7_CAPTE|nr:hypothetical protein CAPTEDRAFT_221068 [Capitella teleta]|eukprot:ELU03102.1 hypothetical protein CAPTEDRAFT_221068 [Capitella teleta]
MELPRNTIFGATITLALIISCAVALPITKTSDSQLPDSAPVEKSSQTSSEKELESLVQSADEVVAPANPTPEENKEEEAHVEVKAVKELLDEESQDKESEPEVTDTSDVISEPESKRSASETLPRESYYYEPEENEQESYMPPDLMNDLDLSPSTIAQYLLMTGDFDGFNNALADVLTTGIVTEDDIKDYRDAVSVEYESLMKNVVDSESSYFQELAAPLAESFPTPNENYGREPVLPPVQMPLSRQNLMDLPELDIDEQIRQLQWEESMREKNRIAPILTNLLADYYADEDIPSDLENSNEEDLEALYEILQKAMLGDSPAYQDEPQFVEDSQNETDDSTEQELEELSPQQPQEEEAAAQPMDLKEETIFLFPKKGFVIQIGENGNFANVW